MLITKFSSIARCHPVTRNFSRNFRFFKPKNAERKEDIVKTLFRVTNTQVNLYIAERLRRLMQVYSLYRQIYKEYANSIILRHFLKKINFSKLRKTCFALSATVFSWQHDGISDEEMLKEMNEWDNLKNYLFEYAAQKPLKSFSDDENNIAKIPQNWQNVIDQEDVKAWTSPYNDTDFPEYRVYGRFHDITARTFFQVQVDIDYRKQWDQHVVKMDIVDQNVQKNEKIIQWVSSFPYPMKPREYLCTRRTQVDEKNKVMIISARAVSHPACPTRPEYVRITRYESCMIIKPHKSFDEPGFDYYLVYHDDPQLMISTNRLVWMLAKGVTGYIQNLYDASKALQKNQKRQPLNSYTGTQEYITPNYLPETLKQI